MGSRMILLAVSLAHNMAHQKIKDHFLSYVEIYTAYYNILSLVEMLSLALHLRQTN
jgi:hypothetical protein